MDDCQVRLDETERPSCVKDLEVCSFVCMNWQCLQSCSESVEADCLYLRLHVGRIIGEKCYGSKGKILTHSFEDETRVLNKKTKRAKRSF